MKLSPYVSGAVRQFAYWFAHGTLGYPLLEGIDYIGEIMKEESSFAEQAFAIIKRGGFRPYLTSFGLFFPAA